MPDIIYNNVENLEIITLRSHFRFRYLRANSYFIAGDASYFVF